MTPTVRLPPGLIDDALNAPDHYGLLEETCREAYASRGVRGLSAAWLGHDLGRAPTAEEIAKDILDAMHGRLEDHGIVATNGDELRAGVRKVLALTDPKAATYDDESPELVAAGLNLAAEYMLGTLDAIRKALAS